MCEFVSKLPKTTIAATITAVLMYALTKGYIGQEEANLVSALMVASGLVINRDKFLGNDSK